MASGTYDIITVGGGLGGASLAKAMAEQGARVLVLEREKQFKDRVRGEWIAPWGAAEAQALGIYDLLQDSCGHEVPGWHTYLGSDPLDQRNLATTTPQRLPALVFYHPAMQEVLSQAAKDAGAEVWRGATVRGVTPGQLPTVTVEQDGRVEELQARLVVGVDGRTSLVRKWGGFITQQDSERRLIAGAFFEELLALHADHCYVAFEPSMGQAALLVPQGDGRVRSYFLFPHSAPYRIQGGADLPRFIEESVRTGLPAEFFTGARMSGPLATFSGAETWVEHPYQDGVTLVGDAAAASDPTWGQGLSLTLRDARVLRDQLLKQPDWEAAGHAYAEAHDRYYSAIHSVNNWFTELFLETGGEAEARRAQALPLIAADSTRRPDHHFSGPEQPNGEAVRRRFFGEE